MAYKYGFWRLHGSSMVPQIEPGSVALVLPCWGMPVGKLVLVDHPHYGRMVKRLLEVDSKGMMLLAGLNEASLSTEQMGKISSSCLLGRVWWHS